MCKAKPCRKKRKKKNVRLTRIQYHEYKVFTDKTLYEYICLAYTLLYVLYKLCLYSFGIFTYRHIFYKTILRL